MAQQSSQDVKRRIKSVTSMEHITNAMKLVSSAKLRKARKAYDATNRNYDFIDKTIDDVFTNFDSVPEDYLTGAREIKKACYILITGNKGLCGSFNTNLIKKFDEVVDAETAEVLAIAIGGKGRDHIRKKDIRIVAEYLSPPEDIEFRGVQKAIKPIVEAYNDGRVDKFSVISTRFISAMEQEVQETQILPFEARADDAGEIHRKDVDYEPSREAVFNYLIPKHVEISLYNAIVESATCEHAARRLAMENATDAARDMLEDLTLSYNRARQSAITDEIIEIVSGSKAQMD